MTSKLNAASAVPAAIFPKGTLDSATLLVDKSLVDYQRYTGWLYIVVGSNSYEAKRIAMQFALEHAQTACLHFCKAARAYILQGRKSGPAPCMGGA